MSSAENGRLVIAAFWSHNSAAEVAAALKPHTIPGSGAVVDLTPTQVDQPRLRNVLRSLNLEEAADFGVPQRPTPRDEAPA